MNVGVDSTLYIYIYIMRGKKKKKEKNLFCSASTY